MCAAVHRSRIEALIDAPGDPQLDLAAIAAYGVGRGIAAGDVDAQELGKGVGQRIALRPARAQSNGRLTVHATFTGMNSAGFRLAMSTTCAYREVVRGSAWPSISCTARRSPVCK